ncbi:MAG: hypothetical protein NT007_05505 [Candidatus Kapabacteria bacterium]|nr:hypothetical protein [Candidatus Kapabacteria bacterium]
MWEDAIVEDIRQVREKHAAKFNYDIDAIYCDLKEKQKKSGLQVISYLNGNYVKIEQAIQAATQ